MTVGELNKGAIALILVLLLGAGGYLWYSQMYKPAVAEHVAAAASAKTAEDGLAAAKQQLATAQQQAEAAKQESAKVDDSVARLAKARTAIPDRKLLDDAAIVLVELANRSGVQTSFKAGSDGGADQAAPAEGALQGATPIDLEFEAAGTYSEMMQFMSLVEDTVEERDDKLFTRGRLFNVVSLEIGSSDEEENASSGGFSGESGEPAADDDGFVIGPNDIRFTVIVRMYTSSTGNAESVGLATPDDAAAAGIDPATGGAAATGTGAPADGSAAGTTPDTTTTTTDGAAPSVATDGAAAAPTGGPS